MPHGAGRPFASIATVSSVTSHITKDELHRKRDLKVHHKKITRSQEDDSEGKTLAE